mgnify:CR=1 FL=1
MKKELPFSIIFKNSNIDFYFDLHKDTRDLEAVGKITSLLINSLDKEIKKNSKISEGDLIQALAFFVATRIVISSFDDQKILDFFNSVLHKGISNIRTGTKTNIGNC